jgi:hypothetical protein
MNDIYGIYWHEWRSEWSTTKPTSRDVAFNTDGSRTVHGSSPLKNPPNGHIAV